MVRWKTDHPALLEMDNGFLDKDWRICPFCFYPPKDKRDLLEFNDSVMKWASLDFDTPKDLSLIVPKQCCNSQDCMLTGETRTDFVRCKKVCARLPHIVVHTLKPQGKKDHKCWDAKTWSNGC